MTGPTKFLFTISDYYKLADIGILRPDERVELVRGEIFKKHPKSPQHAGMVNWLNQHLVMKFLHRKTVRCQNPVRIGDFSEPEPDLLVADYQKDKYRSRHPCPADVHLLIEVADSSLVYDRSIKAALYAGAGIPEYWIVNLRDEQVEVFRQPVEGGVSGHGYFPQGRKSGMPEPRPVFGGGRAFWLIWLKT